MSFLLGVSLFPAFTSWEISSIFRPRKIVGRPTIMTIKIGLIAPSDAGLVWSLAASLLELAVPYSGGRYTLEDMYDQISRGDQLLWLVAENPRQPIAAFTTRVVEYPSSKSLSCQFCGGERMDEWISQCDDLLARFAKDAGCDFIELTGRPGWSRKLPTPWAEEFRLYRRPIDVAPVLDRTPPP